ncbi:MAG TPA: hypothetical protein PLE45_07120 [Spirochaetota bacterium]|nr:hypothetical protein [Spirochaetota bacterium]HOL56949.1 hypothetical protein [Spirochaetota bacterium]
MKRFYLFIFLFIFFTLNIYSQSSKIFCVNLYANPIDLMVGEEDSFIFKGVNISSYQASSYVETTESGSYKIYIKESDSDQWISLNDKGNVLTYNIDKGGVYVLVVDTQGLTHFFKCKDSKENGAKILFLNGSQKNVSRMEVSKKWKEGSDGVYTENVPAFTVSNIVALESGKYSLFWQFPDQVKNNNYYYYPDKNGNEFKYNFDKGKYYLFLVYTKNNKEYANFFILN